MTFVRVYILALIFVRTLGVKPSVIVYKMSVLKIGKLTLKMTIVDDLDMKVGVKI